MSKPEGESFKIEYQDHQINTNNQTPNNINIMSATKGNVAMPQHITNANSDIANQGTQLSQTETSSTSDANFTGGVHQDTTTHPAATEYQACQGSTNLERSTAQFHPLANDPSGYYSAALENELGLNDARSAPSKKNNPQKARISDERATKKFDFAGFQKASQRRRGTYGSITRQYLRSQRPAAVFEDGVDGGDNGGEFQGPISHSRQFQGFAGLSRGQGSHPMLDNKSPVSRNLFENQPLIHNTPPNYGGLEHKDPPTVPSGGNAALSSPIDSIAHPSALPNSQVDFPIETSSGASNENMSAMSSPLTVDDEDYDDNDALFIPDTSLRRSAFSRKVGAKPSRGGAAPARAVNSLRKGKRPFSASDYGSHQDNDFGPPAKIPRHSNTQNSRQFGLQDAYSPNAWANFQNEAPQQPSTPATHRVQSRSQLQRDASQGDEEMTDHQEEYSPAPRSRQSSMEQPFNHPGRNMRPSRYSGEEEPFNINQDPRMVDQAEVSDAALLKRDLNRGNGEKICKRGYGANDPENIMIVNLRETESKSFEQIAKIMNQRRISLGREPTLSTTSVTSRYSRTAPLLFAAQGEEFIPLSKRGGRGKRDAPAFKMTWTDQLDVRLVQIVKDVEREKWHRVAERFAMDTGKTLSPQAAALRHTML